MTGISWKVKSITRIRRCWPIAAAIVLAFGIVILVSDRRIHTKNARHKEEEKDAESLANDGTLVLTGQAARDAARRYLRWWWAGAIILVIAVLSGWLLWHRSADQLTYILFGVSALMVSGLLWRFGVIGFSYWSGQEPSLTLRISGYSRRFMATVLALAGIALIVAATSTGLGSVLALIAHGGIVIWEFAKAAWELIISITLFGFALVQLLRPGGRAIGLILLVFYVFAGLFAFILYQFAPAEFHGLLDEFLHPYREVWRLLTGR